MPVAVDASPDTPSGADAAHDAEFARAVAAPDDYVIATGESHTVREVLDIAFGALGLPWEPYVEFDPRYLRPTEVDHLRGDATRARDKLGWKPTVTFAELITMMVRADEEDVRGALAGRAPPT